ncbi:MAG TPA: hypothetical protein VFX58_02095, partial [Chitinophagaceae bacterium]|nr:hypothetical protein [Chitinophagaceae bacterium]
MFTRPPSAAFNRIFLPLLLMICDQVFAQPVQTTSPRHSSLPSTPFLPDPHRADLFGNSARYIQNIGQYGSVLEGYENMGEIRFAFEGLEMPVLFTQNGFVFLQRKINKLTEKQREEAERSGALNAKTEEGRFYTDRRITMQWMNASPDVVIKTEDASSHYYTYASISGQARGFSKIIYQELYPGIDLVCSFTNNGKPGFEYSLRVKPGADPAQVKFRLGGDIKEVLSNPDGSLLINSDINGILQTAPLSFYSNEEKLNETSNNKNSGEKIESEFIARDQEFGFHFPNGYDKTKLLVIDPFVSSTSSLSGANTGIAKDIDFDYNGNIYVSGGGNSAFNLLAKFDPAGNLLWTFSGTLVVPAWTFGYNYGGWVVEKTTGKIYLGQGGTASYRIIRLTTDGLYDNYITTGSTELQENWKMIWNCDGGTPKILVAGGGSASQNINFGICTPPSTVLTQLNITGQPTGHQDLADMIVDPRTNEMYTIFAQGFITPITENNRMYKHRPPYNPANIIWNRLSGFNVLNERANRPYLNDATGFNDNSINALAVNSRYLFYYDGRNLAAMNKANGNNLGTPVNLTLSTELLQGGIIADECDNVYVGSKSGTIKVYRFTGSGFDDNAAPDLTIAGFSNAPVYDLAYDNAKSLLYACGKGFVSAINISSYCASNIYTVTLAPDCPGLSVQASISPALPSGSTISYSLYQGNNLVSTNSNGSFSDLRTNTDYMIRAKVDEACGGTQAIKSFNMNNCAVNSPVGAGIYVPGGFTPNNDGLNDIIRPV